MSVVKFLSAMQMFHPKAQTIKQAADLPWVVALRRCNYILYGLLC